MSKERQYFLLNNLTVFLVLFFALTPLTFAQETVNKPRVIFTNDEFSSSQKDQQKAEENLEKNSNNLSNNSSANKSVSSENKLEEMPDIDLQFRALDLQLAIAQDPKNQTLRQQQININTQLRQSPLVKPTENDLKDLAFKQKYIGLKLALVAIEKQLQEASSKIQQERRKIITGSQGNVAFEGVRVAEDSLDALQKQSLKLQLELNTILEEGRRLGVSSRVFR
jgi:hypothetical protein